MSFGGVDLSDRILGFRVSRFGFRGLQSEHESGDLDLADRVLGFSVSRFGFKGLRSEDKSW